MIVRAVPGCTGSYMAVGGRGLHRVVQEHTGLYRAVQGFTRLYTVVCGRIRAACIVSYRALRSCTNTRWTLYKRYIGAFTLCCAVYGVTSLIVGVCGAVYMISFPRQFEVSSPWNSFETATASANGSKV